MSIHGWNPKDEAPSLEFFENLDILSKISKNLRKSQIRYLEKGVLGLCRATTIKPSALVFFYWTTTDKLKFIDWSQVKRMFGCGEIAIF